ncbi:collagen alpha-1(I) chain isoform X5 [Anthonomus grandis grandis]|uniref:collagen alpha-1(I) chain isoform X5 n=1 Tax=Anthonomus grandis grandis TaxID=2921223 RepID=UPI0021665F32|nr:collagen alpha-1(I) chain isoform X5 [Anthonomus grandis grandis]
MEPKREFSKIFILWFTLWTFCDFYCHGQSFVDSLQNTIQKNVDKQRTLYDYQTRVVAYKDLIESKCLLEILTNEDSVIKLGNLDREGDTFKPLSSSNQLSKRENLQIWRLAGTRISDFCRGFPTYLIQNPLPDSQTVSYIQNDLPIVEISTKKRKKRETRYNSVGRVRGQTQSQYLNFGKGNGEPGKAEAESSYEGTKAVVSGSSGMGQAQSQSSPVDCGECLGGPGFQDQGLIYGRRPGFDDVPEKITRPGGPGAKYPGEYGPTGIGQTYIPGTRPGGEGGEGYAPGSEGGYVPGGRAPGTAPRPGEEGGRYIPGQERPGGSGRRPSEEPSGFYPSGGRPPSTGPSQGSQPGRYYPSGRPSEGGLTPGTGSSPDQWSQPGRPPTGTGAQEGYPPGTGPTSTPGQWTQPERQPGGPAYPPGTGAPSTPGQWTQPEKQPGGPAYPTGPSTTWSQPGGQPSSPGTHESYPPGTGPTGATPGEYLQPTGPGTQGAYPSGQWLQPGRQPTGPQGGYPPGTGPSSAPDQWLQPGRQPTGTGVPSGQSKPPYSSESGPSPGQWYPPSRQPIGPGISGSPPGSGPTSIPSQWIQPGGHPTSPAAPPGTHGWYPGPNYEGDQYHRGPETGGRDLGTFGGQLSGQYEGHAGHSGRFSGSFQGTYESHGHGGFRPPSEGQGQVGRGPAPAQISGHWVNGKWEPSGGGPAIPQGGGPGPTQGGGQWVDGKWVPSGVGPGPTQGGGQWIDGKWVPSGGGSGPTQGGGQWIDGKWVPSGGGPSGGSAGPTQGEGQWINGKWVPSGTTQEGDQWIDGKWVPSGGGAGPTQGQGQWIDGKWVPSGGGPGPTQGGGQWIDGKLVPSGGGPGPTQGGGQWVDGKWVPSGGGPLGGGAGPTQGEGQWIDGKWVPSGGGPGPTQGGGQWIDGKWVPSGTTQGGGPGPTQGGGQWINGKWVPSGTTQGGSSGPTQGGGQWINGKWVPSGGQGETGGGSGQTEGGGQWINGKWVPSGEGPGTPQGAGQWIDGKWVPSGGGQGSGQWVNGKWVPLGEGYPYGQVPPGQYVAGGGQGETSDDSDSQVQTSVLQGDNETIANAQAQGKYQGGTSQSQVSGTYSGSGSFSASAGSDDGKRGAMTQVSGGKNGAQSSAQGRGGAGQSQAQVSLDPDSGDTLSSAQTSGIQHGTQTQVRASEKGGLADAQANGLGATSSQAQIGFTPYDESEKDNQTTPFKGGGTAAAQSGNRAGMTQTQIQGKFRFGIRYQGAAQAGSGSTAIRNLTEPTGYFKPINFTAARVSHSKQSQSQQATLPDQSAAERSDTAQEETLRQSETSREKLFDVQVQKLSPPPQEDREVVAQEESDGLPATHPPDYAESEEYADPEYEDEDLEEPSPALSPSRRNLVLPRTDIHQSLRKPSSVVSQSSDHQKQHIILDPLDNLDATVHQSKGDSIHDGMILQSGQVVPGSSGFQIPAGFRGKVKSIANGPNTYAIGKHSQAQSVTLSPGSGRIFYSKPTNPVYGVVTKTISRNGHYGTGYAYQPINYPVAYRMKSGKVLPNFVSVSKSEAGEADLVSGKKTPNVYYTQSSSCGMFTNSCVYSNGKKTCFPVRKTNPDGTPMSC